MNNLNHTICHKKKYRSIIHIDRLQLTFRYSQFSAFKNTRNPDAIIKKQCYGNIELILDNRCGTNAYYHTFSVYYHGFKVGRLHTASKFANDDIEFDFEKHVLYSNKHDYWYEIYKALTTDLVLVYNNINYIEICIDSTKCLTAEYGYLYANSIGNKYRFNTYFKTIRNVKPEVLDGGNGFRINGENNSIQIYIKTTHAEDFIKDFFTINGFINETVYRVESKLNWNYLKSLINKKNIVITPEMLMDDGMLFSLFELSVRNKLPYYDLRKKNYNQHRNVKYDRISVLDDIELMKTELLKFNPVLQVNHYKAENTDEDIIRKTYYQYLQTGNEKYFANIRNNAEAAQLHDLDLMVLLNKFSQRYRGDLTSDVRKRMDYALQNYIPKKKGNVISKFFAKLRIKWKNPVS